MTVSRVPTLTVPIPSREHPRAKAIRLLLEGRLTVLSVHGGRVRAKVRGDSGASHLCGFDPSGRGWWCRCQAGGSGRCSHVAALAHVIDTAQYEGGEP